MGSSSQRYCQTSQPDNRNKPRRRSRAPVLERLEDRMLLSGPEGLVELEPIEPCLPGGPSFAQVGDVVNVVATAGDDVIHAVVTPNQRLVITVNNVSSSYDSNTVNHVNINAQCGDDAVTLEPSVVQTSAIQGGAGHDGVSVGGGASTITGGTGNDRLSGGPRADAVYGGWGRDVLAGNGGNDELDGGQGTDYMDGGEGDDLARGGPATDIIFGSEGDDFLEGNDGVDALLGGRGNDVLVGGGNRDYLFGQSGDDNLIGDYLFFDPVPDDFDPSPLEQGGADYMDGGLGNDNMAGWVGNDVMFGRLGDDVIFGEAGDDLIVAGLGRDLVYAGNGNDTVYGDERRRPDGTVDTRTKSTN